MRRKSFGFTLLEAIVVLAIGSIAIGVAVPAFAKAMASTRHVLARTDLVEVLMTAGTHALATDTDVVLCPSGNGATCDRGQTQWSRGWIAFADLDGNRQRSGRETLLRTHGAVAGVGIRSSQGRTLVVFHPRGDAAGTNLTFTLCDSRGAQAASTIVTGNSGRWRIGQAKAEAAARCIEEGWK